MDIINENPDVISEALDEIGVERDEKTVIIGVLGWAKRMAEKNGDTVIDKNGAKLDWGQALCREQFGINWQNYMQTNNISKPTNADFDKALEWEHGATPEWVDKYE
jgi:hypothetical protein